ncbi:type II toxin-antitoxin system VapC family toxin [Rhizobium sp.]
MIDTSVVVKWFVDEDGFENARTLIDRKIERIAPEFMLAETANVLQRKIRGGELQGPQAAVALQNLPYFFDDLVSSKRLIGQAFALSQLLDHSVYDCMYLALTLSEPDAKLVTSDIKFLDKAKAAGYGEKISDLSVAVQVLATGQENDNG